MKPLRCEVRDCTAVTDGAQQGLLKGDGWRVTDDQRWCRPCASTLRDLLNILLLGDAE